VTARQRKDDDKDDAKRSGAGDSSGDVQGDDGTQRRGKGDTPDAPDTADDSNAISAGSGSGGGEPVRGDQTDVHLAAAAADRNSASFVRTEETFAADRTVRGGGPNPGVGSRQFPQAPSREDQEENARLAALEAAKRMTGTEDGVSSVLPAVGGTTNMALTPTELQAQLDDGAVDARGRLVGVYLDDLQAEQAQRQRVRVENGAALDGPDAELRRAAAERVRRLAASEPISAADLGRAPGEQALVNTDRLTGRDQSGANDESRRASALAGRDQSAGTDNTRG
jgi:hypothetical protein